jgi:hypothetical protein
MTMFERIREAGFRVISKALNKDDEERAVFTGSEGDLTAILAADLDKVLNENNSAGVFFPFERR